MRSDGYAVLLMLNEENSESGLAPEAERHACDVAVAQRIAAGDAQSGDSFLVAVRPMITRAAIDWCHRISPGSQCRQCAADGESDCAHYSGAKAMIEDRIRKKATKAYKGQTELALFIECLVGSDWWFWDYTGSHTGHLPLSKTEPPAQGHHRSDLLHAWAVLGGSESAWNAFLDAFNDHIVRTAITWCHRAIPARVCRNCKPGVVHGCDAFGDAYLYILERLRSTALAAYGGHTALSSFVFLCLHDYRWWASFVQKETGKIKLPKALSDEPELVQVLYFRIAWGWDNERIATGLQMPLQVVEETRGHIEEKLRNAGRTISPRKIECGTGRNCRCRTGPCFALWWRARSRLRRWQASSASILARPMELSIGFERRCRNGSRCDELAAQNPLPRSV